MIKSLILSIMLLTNAMPVSNLYDNSDLINAWQGEYVYEVTFPHATNPDMAYCLGYYIKMYGENNRLYAKIDIAGWMQETSILALAVGNSEEIDLLYVENLPEDSLYGVADKYDKNEKLLTFKKDKDKIITKWYAMKTTQEVLSGKEGDVPDYYFDKKEYTEEPTEHTTQVISEYNSKADFMYKLMNLKKNIQAEKMTTGISEETTTESTSEYTQPIIHIKPDVNHFAYLDKDKTINNSYFFKEGISDVKGKLRYKTLELNDKDVHMYTLYEEEKTADVTLHIKKLGTFENGTVYNLSFNTDDATASYLYTYSSFAEQRLNLCLYVTPERIYKISTPYDFIKSEEELLEGSTILSQNEEIKDSIPESENGKHYYIKDKGNVKEMYSYSGAGGFENASDNARCFYFEKDKGLTYYSSSCEAQRYLIEITLNVE